MEECNICGNDQFVTEEKRVQCSLCLTYYDVAVNNVETGSGSKRGLKRKRDTKTSKKEKRNPSNSEPLGQAETESKIIEWTTHEAFNIILKKQVDCLIKLGASHKLRDVVLQLWARYLQLIFVAFPDRDPDEDVFFSVPQNRDFSFANSKKYKLKRRRVSVFHGKPHSNPVAPRSKKHKEKIVKDSSSDEDDGIPLLFLQMEKLKEELNKESDTISENQDAIYWKKMIDLKRLMKVQQSVVSCFACKQVDYMNMIKTVSFCYLGILIVEDSILLSDIIRWIREGDFPYLEALSLLPSNMKFHHTDHFTFTRTDPPSCYEVRQAAGKLAYFLELQDFTKPSLDVIVARHILDLDLPKNWQNVLPEHDSNPGKNTIPQNTSWDQL